MSLISKALKKIQDSRENLQENKTNNIVYLTDAPQSWPRTALMAILIVSTLAAIVMSMTAVTVSKKNSESKQIQVLKLEKIIKTQEKKINDLLTGINKNNKISNNQMRDLKLRLKNDTKDVDLEIGKLSSNSKENYAHLKEAILNDRQEIEFLINYTKKLDRKIESISVSNSQTQDVTSPASGN